jgi:hypothetical protein
MSDIFDNTVIHTVIVGLGVQLLHKTDILLILSGDIVSGKFKPSSLRNSFWKAGIYENNNTIRNILHDAGMNARRPDK